jgi:hypothetical protein
MSTIPETRPQSAISVHLPVAILAFAIAVFIFAQQRATSAQSDYLRWQRENISKQHQQLIDLEKQMKDAFTQREPAVKQAIEVQSVFQNILSDVLRLAEEGDKDSQEIVAAWKIQKPAPAPAPAGAAAAPAGSTAPAATPAPAAK